MQADTLATIVRVINKFSGCVRSMKIIKKAFIDLQEDEKNFMKEIAILRTLDHMNILKIYEFYQDDKCFYLIMEFCSEGDLFDKIQKEAPFNEYTACHIIYQILSAIVYCHSSNIVHRDIKADCILIESTETVTYNGVNLVIPNGYVGELSDDYGVVFNTSDKAYSIDFFEGTISDLDSALLEMGAVSKGNKEINDIAFSLYSYTKSGKTELIYVTDTSTFRIMGFAVNNSYNYQLFCLDLSFI